jgi:GrpB-like predicted nucleotidyltransferase (UPF0157 family)
MHPHKRSVAFAELGLGVQYATIRLVPADERWAGVAQQLIAQIDGALTGIALGIEQVGSSSVPGMIAKPIIDLAIGVSSNTSVDALAAPLTELGWIYRGDAGDKGGWVFVLEDAPGNRVAHAHGVEFGGRQWTRYLQFRELLRTDATARATYANAKLELAEQFPDGGTGYLAGKEPVVDRLLA